jgi:hypothetical protein
MLQCICRRLLWLKLTAVIGSKLSQKVSDDELLTKLSQLNRNL